MVNYAIGREINGKTMLYGKYNIIITYQDLTEAKSVAKQIGWDVYKLEKMEIQEEIDKEHTEEKKPKDEKSIKIESVIKDLFDNYESIVRHNQDSDTSAISRDLNNYRKIINRLSDINNDRVWG